jgi:hypothetical protein
MNEELLAASALLVQSGALLVSHIGLINFSAIVQPKSEVHQQSAKLFQQHWRHPKENYDLNSAFEKADRLLEETRTGGQSVSLPKLCH